MALRHHGQNFVKTMLKLGRERETLRVVADQWGCPTYAADLAGAVLKVAGLYLAGRRSLGNLSLLRCGMTSWHGFAVGDYLSLLENTNH
jgi:dTDP-4-dehydrorhamnose reductase